MLKFIIGFQRRKGMSRAECHKHLRTVHGPLVRSVPEFTRHVRGYVQNFAEAEIRGLHNPNYVADGAAELWFDDAGAFVTAYSEPIYLRDIRPDEANFTDPTRYVASFSKESVAWADPVEAPYKLIRFLVERPGSDPGRAAANWQGPRMFALASDPALRRLAPRYVQSWSIPASENPFPLAESFAVVDEFWFPSLQAAGEFAEAERNVDKSLALADTMDIASAISLVVREGTVIERAT